jgi:hypothetical protein
MLVFICYPTDSGKHKIPRSRSRLAWAKSENLISKIIKAKRVGGMAQAVEYLPSKYKAPSSSPSTDKKKKKKVSAGKLSLTVTDPV